MSTDYTRLRDMSVQLFGRGLFLPVAAWIDSHKRRRALYFSDVREGLREGGLRASEGPLSEELGELERLEMITRGTREGRYVPYRVRPHELWRLIKLAKGLEWRPPPQRRAGRR